MRSIFGLAFSLGILSACGTSTPDTAAQNEQGREETRNIRNTESIGYSGDAIANKVDGALDANDQRQQKLDDAEASNY